MRGARTRAAGGQGFGGAPEQDVLSHRISPDHARFSSDREPLAGTSATLRTLLLKPHEGSATMNGIIYLVGLVVIVMFVLSFLGLR